MGKASSVTFLILLIVSVSLFGVGKRIYMESADHFKVSTSVPALPEIRFLETVAPDKKTDFRLIFVGDVHGQYVELMSLINDKLGGLDDQTTVVLLGDVISKGPDSSKVASFILNNKDRVKFVLGNHDLAVLFAYLNPKLNYYPSDQMKSRLIPLKFSISGQSFIPKDISKVKKMHFSLAQELGVKVLTELALHCSLALEYKLPTGEVLYAVHAGMLPGDFSERTPSIDEITEMKYVATGDWTHTAKKKFNKSEKWYKLWDDIKEPITVLYGHDAKRGLNLRNHTKGLDSGCVKGGKLSAIEYKYDHREGTIRETLFQTECANHLN